MTELLTAGVVLLSSFIFYLAIRIFLVLLACAPQAVSTCDIKEITWRWYNVCVSLVHAFFAGFGCLFCFMEDPLMTEDLEHRHSIVGIMLIAASTGYFIYDALDMLLSVPLSRSWEVLAHHVVVITCFGVVLKTGLFVAYAIIALLVEVNSIFLHARQLLRMARVSHDCLLYQTVAVLNVVTFIVFRFITLLWMMWWLWANYQNVVQPYFSILVGSLPLMLIINIGLLIQVLSKDAPHFVTYLIKKLKQW